MMDTLMPRVLVVDDEDATRDLLEHSLLRAGFGVRCVANGQAGLKPIEQWAPDAIVLDFMLPRVDGTRFCRCYAG
jgi:CheY-like chemotaxis protein